MDGSAPTEPRPPGRSRGDRAGLENRYGPAGNVDAKYETRNPLARRLVAGFLRSFDALVARTGARRVLDVGCGEGVLSCRLGRRGYEVLGVDVSPAIIAEAAARWRGCAPDAAAGAAVRFEALDLYGLDPGRHRSPLVVCCEVLEHVPDPAAALACLSRLADPFLLVSVPREPIWRALNLARGRYVRDLGNTPGHVQHWSKGGFLSFLAPSVEIVAVHAPLPWTMVLARVRHG